MSCCGYNNANNIPISSKYVYQTPREEAPETSIPEVLELIHNTHDIVLLTRAFYLLGLYLVSEERGCDKIIKCKVLYDKILMVLNCGLQTKVCIALNLIWALLFFGNEQGYSRRQTLHIYAQNMIKTSGCLAAMCDLFTNCMMRRVTLRSLCRSLSAAAGVAQAQCAHLVAQCIQRCRQDYIETFPLLQILLSKNDRNIQLFHESNGMTIFTRESLQHPDCLHLLSTLAENTNPQNKIILKQSSEIFDILPCLLSKYGSDSLVTIYISIVCFLDSHAFNKSVFSRILEECILLLQVGKWALIILYSQHEAINTDKINNVGNENNDTAKDDAIPIKHIKHERKSIFPYSNNETSQLFRNVYKEIMMLPQQDNNINNKKNYLNCYKDILVLGKDNGFRMNYGFTNNRKEIEQDHKIHKNKCTSPSRLTITKTNDLSFSFLLKQNTDMNVNTTTRCTENINHSLKKKHLYEETQPLNDFVKYKQSEIEQHFVSNLTKTDLESNVANNTILEFKPLFVSTPKRRNTRLKTTRMSTSRTLTLKSLSIIRQTKLNTKVQKVYKSKHLIRTQLKEKKQNKSMSTKFLDLINGSCTTLVKSFTNIKNIFKRKIDEEVGIKETKSIVIDQDTDNNASCTYSFTNYMQKRDAHLREIDNNTLLTKELTENTNNYCNTCNDTGAIRQKFVKDKSLQETIKKLKLGINLYGCNFKKISRTMWPRENYMTPSVLYNLYRKLIK